MTCAGSPLGEREKVTWADVARIPLCLLTPDMQNRRIIDRLLVNAAAPPPLESNSMLVLFSHVRIGGFACVAPEKLASLLSLREPLRAIPILEPQEIYTIGLVSPRQEPIPPLRGHSQPKRANWRCPKTKDLDAILIDRFFHGWLR
ncbi:MAG: hypothetical protein USCAAHI_02361 [Beijerinckiaceae bacterium]|nr:MAG: hypothetical protein USCAAHI_02361 [Beijerinckiaceae bacterium]